MSKPVEFEDAIAAAREAVGSPEAVARLRSDLTTRLGAPADGAQAPAQLAPANGTAAKLALLAAAGLIAVGGASYLARERTAPQTRERIVRIEAAPAPRAKPTLVEPVPQPEPDTLDPAPPVSASVPTAARRARTPPRAATILHPQPTAASPTPSEVELLTRAQALLESQPSAARALLDQHLRAYPRGMLGEERDLLRVDAELQLGQRDRARELARQFIERYPRSAQVRRFQLLLETQERRPSETHRTTLERKE